MSSHEMIPHDTTGCLRISLREARLTVERNLMLLGVPKGAREGVREAVIDAEALGLGALPWLDTQLEVPWRTPSLAREECSSLGIDAGGVPAPYVVPALLDLTLAVATEHGQASVHVDNVTSPRLLAALEPAARRYDAAVTVTSSGGPDGPGTAHIDCPAGAVPDGSAPAVAAPTDTAPPLDAVVHEGFRVDAELWWRIYHRSNEALTIDTPLSRGHAGALPANASPAGEEDSGPAEAASPTDPDYLPATGT